MYIAIDIGGTKTLIAFFSGTGKLLKSQRFETPPNYNDFLTTLSSTYQSMGEHGIPKLCVVGAPGKIDRKSGTALAFGNLLWENTPIGKDVQKIINTPVLVENDANLAGLSEAILISHQYKKVLYMTVSTGIGGTLVINGKIDPVYADTEFGHMQFERDGRLQEWEDFASGRALYEKYGKKASELEDTGAWYEVSHNLALGLNNVITTLNPEVVVIGGGVGAHFEKFGERLYEELMIMASNMISVPPLRQAIRAEEAVIYGCYELAKQHNS